MNERNLTGVNIDKSVIQKGNKTRKISMAFISAACISSILGWYFSLSNMITTDDAYTSGNELLVSTQVSGRVIHIGPTRTDLVRKGDILVRVDNADALIKYKNAESKLTQALKMAKEHYVSICSNDTNIIKAQMAYQQSLYDYNRRVQSQGVSVISTTDLQQALKSVDSSKISLDSAILKYQRNQIAYQISNLVRQHAIIQATEELREARMALSHTEVRSPVTGYVLQRHVHAGVDIHSGQILMSIVPADQIWVNANFKATQVSNIEIGQKASIITDQYGRKVIFEGLVEGVNLAGDTALLAQSSHNEADNWSDNMQRIPVRISIDPIQMSQYPLRMGSSTQVTLHHGYFHLVAY